MRRSKYVSHGFWTLTHKLTRCSIVPSFYLKNISKATSRVPNLSEKISYILQGAKVQGKVLKVLSNWSLSPERIRGSTWSWVLRGAMNIDLLPRGTCLSSSSQWRGELGGKAIWERMNWTSFISWGWRVSALKGHKWFLVVGIRLTEHKLKERERHHQLSRIGKTTFQYVIP